MKNVLVLSCTGAFAACGAWLGTTSFDETARALLATLAGAAGGFGIANAAWTVRDLWRVNRPAPASHSTPSR